jgi:hypothetical protein
MAENRLPALVTDALDELKGVDVQCIDVRGITAITDWMVVASGTSDRHVKALAPRRRRGARPPRPPARGRRAPRRRPRPVAAGLGDELADQPARDARGEQRLALRDDPYCRAELVRLDVLEQEAARARVERLEHVLVELERREHDHPDRRQTLVRSVAPGAQDARYGGRQREAEDLLRRRGLRSGNAKDPVQGRAQRLPQRLRSAGVLQLIRVLQQHRLHVLGNGRQLRVVNRRLNGYVVVTGFLRIGGDMNEDSLADRIDQVEVVGVTVRKIKGFLELGDPDLVQGQDVQVSQEMGMRPGRLPQAGGELCFLQQGAVLRPGAVQLRRLNLEGIRKPRHLRRPP